MHPVFVARGPAFKKNYSTNADIHIKSVDVYELVCFILNLKPYLKINYNFSMIDEFHYFSSLFHSSWSRQPKLAKFRILGAEAAPQTEVKRKGKKCERRY